MWSVLEGKPYFKLIGAECAATRTDRHHGVRDFAGGGASRGRCRGLVELREARATQLVHVSKATQKLVDGWTGGSRWSRRKL